MNESKKIILDFSIEELEVLINAIRSSNPTDKDHEVIQFKLYHKLLFKLNENK